MLVKLQLLTPSYTTLLFFVALYVISKHIVVCVLDAKTCNVAVPFFSYDYKYPFRGISGYLSGHLYCLLVKRFWNILMRSFSAKDGTQVYSSVTVDMKSLGRSPGPDKRYYIAPILQFHRAEVMCKENCSFVHIYLSCLRIVLSCRSDFLLCHLKNERSRGILQPALGMTAFPELPPRKVSGGIRWPLTCFRGLVCNLKMESVRKA